MKAIVTKYKGPTNTRGATIRVSAEGVKTKVYSYEHAEHDPHEAAASKFALELGWIGELTEGALPNGERVFVFTDTAKAEARATQGVISLAEYGTMIAELASEARERATRTDDFAEALYEVIERHAHTLTGDRKSALAVLDAAYKHNDRFYEQFEAMDTAGTVDELLKRLAIHTLECDVFQHVKNEQWYQALGQVGE